MALIGKRPDEPGEFAGRLPAPLGPAGSMPAARVVDRTTFASIQMGSGPNFTHAPTHRWIAYG